MIMDIYYAIGDYVRYNSKEGEITRENCGFCDGTGSLTGKNGAVIECPICDGTGYLEYDNRKGEFKVGVVNDIQVRWYRDRNVEVKIDYLIDNKWVNQLDIFGTLSAEEAALVEDNPPIEYFENGGI